MPFRLNPIYLIVGFVPLYSLLFLLSLCCFSTLKDIEDHIVSRIYTLIAVSLFFRSFLIMGSIPLMFLWAFMIQGNLTPLVEASKEGRVAIVDYLLKMGADIKAIDNVRPTSPISIKRLPIHIFLPLIHSFLFYVF